MQKVLLVPDSFKGTMSSMMICDIMKRAIYAHYPRARVVSIPVADGGEGSVDCFLAALGGDKHTVTVRGPKGEPVEAFFGLLPGKTAVVEMAAAAGLPLMGEEKDAEAATTYGVGQLMSAALDAGCRKLILGLGGSATNDGGCGCAAALGVKFYDAQGNTFVPVGGTLHRIARIDPAGTDARLAQVDFVTMCDIDNPLCGPQGAAHVFGPQKGADAAAVERLDAGLAHLAEVLARDVGRDVRTLPGAGAAGGMGGGMAAFFKSPLQMGIDAVLDTVRFDTLAAGADAVFTGEGRLDAQSLRGKVVIGVARRAKKAGVPVVAVVGDVGEGAKAAYAEGVSAIFSINRVAVPYSAARLRAPQDLADTMDDILRVMADAPRTHP